MSDLRIASLVTANYSCGYKSAKTPDPKVNHNKSAASRTGSGRKGSPTTRAAMKVPPRFASLVKDNYSFGYKRPELPDPLSLRLAGKKTWDKVDLMPCQKNNFNQMMQEASDRREAVAKQVKKKKKRKPVTGKERLKDQVVSQAVKERDQGAQDKDEIHDQVLLNNVESNSDSDTQCDNEYGGSEMSVNENDTERGDGKRDTSSPTTDEKMVPRRPKFGLVKQLSNIYRKVSASVSPHGPNSAKKSRRRKSAKALHSEHAESTENKVSQNKSEKPDDDEAMDNKSPISGELTPRAKAPKNKLADPVRINPLKNRVKTNSDKENVKTLNKSPKDRSDRDGNSAAGVRLSPKTRRIPLELRKEEDKMSPETKRANSSDLSSRNAKDKTVARPLTEKTGAAQKSPVSKRNDSFQKAKKNDNGNKSSGVVSVRTGLTKRPGQKKMPSPRVSPTSKKGLEASVNNQALQPLKNPPPKRPRVNVEANRIIKGLKEKRGQNTSNLTTISVPRSAVQQTKLPSGSASKGLSHIGASLSSYNEYISSEMVPPGGIRRLSKVLSPQTANKLKLAKKKLSETATAAGAPASNNLEHNPSGSVRNQVPETQGNHPKQSGSPPRANESNLSTPNSTGASGSQDHGKGLQKASKKEDTQKKYSKSPKSSSAVSRIPRLVKKTVASGNVMKKFLIPPATSTKTVGPQSQTDETLSKESEKRLTVKKSSPASSEKPAASTKVLDNTSQPASSNTAKKDKVSGKESRRITEAKSFKLGTRQLPSKIILSRTQSGKKSTRKGSAGPYPLQPTPHREPWRITGAYVPQKPVFSESNSGQYIKEVAAIVKDRKQINEPSSGIPVLIKSADPLVSREKQDASRNESPGAVSMSDAAESYTFKSDLLDKFNKKLAEARGEEFEMLVKQMSLFFQDAVLNMKSNRTNTK